MEIKNPPKGIRSLCDRVRINALVIRVYAVVALFVCVMLIVSPFISEAVHGNRFFADGASAVLWASAFSAVYAALLGSFLGRDSAEGLRGGILSSGHVYRQHENLSEYFLRGDGAKVSRQVFGVPTSAWHHQDPENTATKNGSRLDQGVWLFCTTSLPHLGTDYIFYSFTLILFVIRASLQQSLYTCGRQHNRRASLRDSSSGETIAPGGVPL
jgi:hypothetical protein